MTSGVNKLNRPTIGEMFDKSAPMTPTVEQIVQGLVEIVEQAFDAAGNAYSDPRWGQPKVVKEARLWLAVQEAQRAGEKLAVWQKPKNFLPGHDITIGTGYARTAKSKQFYRPVSRKRDR